MANHPHLPGNEELLESRECLRFKTMTAWGHKDELVSSPNGNLLLHLHLGPRLCSLGFQSRQPGLELGLSTTEICHHGLHLLPVFLAECFHLHGSLGFLVLLQQPVKDGSTVRVT